MLGFDTFRLMVCHGLSVALVHGVCVCVCVCVCSCACVHVYLCVYRRLAQALVLGFGKCELLDLRDNIAVSRVFLHIVCMRAGFDCLSVIMPTPVC